MQDAELLVQGRHLLAVWGRVPGHLAILLLLAPPLRNAGCGGWQQPRPVGKPCDKRGGERDERAPAVGGIKHASDATGGAEGGLAGQGHCDDGGQDCLHAEVPGESIGLQVGELQSRESLELDDGPDAGLCATLSEERSESLAVSLTYVDCHVWLARPWLATFSHARELSTYRQLFQEETHS